MRFELVVSSLALPLMLVCCGPSESSNNGAETQVNTRQIAVEAETEAEGAAGGFTPTLDSKHGEKVEFVIGSRIVPRSEFEALLGGMYISSTSVSHGAGHIKRDCSYFRKKNDADPDCVSGEIPTFDVEFHASHRDTGALYTYSRREVKHPTSPVTTHRLRPRGDQNNKVMRPLR